MSVQKPSSIYRSRIERLREKMVAHQLDVCLISSPESIFYLTGLSHQGYFALHLLIVSLCDEAILITRAMEEATISVQVHDARFIGYADTQNPAEIILNQLRDFETSIIGIEKQRANLTIQLWEALHSQLQQARWFDISDLIFEIRRKQSPEELLFTRKAVEVASTMMQTAIDHAHAGVSEQEIATGIYQAMVSSGGEYPGFHPFVRSNPTLPQEHVTWSDRQLESGDKLFVELAGCSNRYHAPMGRLIYIDSAPPETRMIEKVCLDAFDKILDTMKPGVKASAVYRAWQSVVDQAGLAHYRRHHCGYLVGIAFPPAWTGGNTVIGLREGNDLILEAGMVFHTMSWLMNSGQGDYFVSDTVIITDDACEAPTTVSRSLTIK